MKRQMVMVMTTIAFISMVLCLFSVTAEGTSIDSYEPADAVDDGNTIVIDNLRYSIDTESKTADVLGLSDDANASGITKITIPGTIDHDGEHYNVKDIVSNAFNGVNSLTIVYIKANESSVERSIGDNAFANDSSLRTLTIPANNELGGGFVSVGDGAFTGTAISNPNLQKISKLGDSAFKDCTKLKFANINNVTEIGNNTFSGCTSLSSVKAENLMSVGDGAFSGCTSLNTISAPVLVSIGSQAFTGCSSLTNVSIGECDFNMQLFQDSSSLNFISMGGVYHPIIDGSIGDYDESNAAFSIGSNFYPTIETAFDNLDKGETLTMLNDLEISSFTIENVDDFIFDLGDKTLTVTSYSGISLVNSNGILQNGKIISEYNDDTKLAVAISLGTLCELTVSDLDVSIMNTSSNSDTNNTAFLLESQSRLTMENGSTISSNPSETAYGSIGVVIYGPGNDESAPTELIVNKGVSINVGQYGISGYGLIKTSDDTGTSSDSETNRDDYRNTSIIINGATINAEYGWGIYHPQIGTLTINDGAKVSGLTGIEMRSGTLIINDAEVTATADYSTDPSSKASSVYGAAIAVAPYRGADSQGTVTVDISDGKFDGSVAFAQSNPLNIVDPGFDFSITGGEFSSNGSNPSTNQPYPAVIAKEATGFISGGTFNGIVEKSFVDPSVPMQVNPDGSVSFGDSIVPVQEPTPGDDDDEFVPPYIPQQSSGDDDTTLYIACCSAAAVVALLAIIIVMNERKR